MSGENENPQTRGSGGRPRRSSLAEMFGSRPSVDTAAVNGNNLPKPSTSMASAIAQQAQQQSQTRRLSITSLGLSGSPTRPQGTAFDTLRERGQASGGRGRRQMEADESAVDEDGDSIGPINGESGSRPTSPSMGRRLSFGAKAYNEARKGSVGNNSSESSPTNGNIAGSKGSSPPNARKGAGMLRTDPLSLEAAYVSWITLLTIRHICRGIQLVRQPSHSS